MQNWDKMTANFICCTVYLRQMSGKSGGKLLFFCNNRKVLKRKKYEYLDFFLVSTNVEPCYDLSHILIYLGGQATIQRRKCVDPIGSLSIN